MRWVAPQVPHRVSTANEIGLPVARWNVNAGIEALASFNGFGCKLQFRNDFMSVFAERIVGGRSGRTEEGIERLLHFSADNFLHCVAFHLRQALVAIRREYTGRFSSCFCLDHVKILPSQKTSIPKYPFLQD